jgi:hypothetical protein
VATRESTGAWLGSAVLHGALLAGLLAQVATPAPAVVDELVELEVVELPTTPSPRPSPRLAVDTAVRGTSPVISEAPPPPRPVETKSPPAIPKPPPPGVPARVDATAEATVPVASEPSASPAEPAPTAVPAPAIHMLARPIGVGGNSGTGTFGEAGLGGDDEDPDHTAYVAAIARIVRAELDEHPVPGISELDTMRLRISVLPSGELAWRGEGKYAFGEVLSTSLGRVRVNQILKRVMIASSRFPAHPHGRRSPHYFVDIVFVFTPKR